MIHLKPAFLVILTLFIQGSLFAQVQSSEERDGKTAFIQGMQAFVNDEFDRSATLLLQANELISGNSGILYALADVYLQQDDLPRAALYGKEAVRLEPENKWYGIKLATIYRSAGQNDATLDELNRILSYHPDDTDALFMLADTQKEYGQFLQSLGTLEKIYRLRGPGPFVLLRKFQNFEALGAVDSAIVQLELLRKEQPGNLNTLNLLSEYYQRTGNENKAKEVLKDALYRNARHAESLVNLAGLYIDEFKWDSAGTLLGDFIRDPLNKNELKLTIAQYMYTRQQNNPASIQLQIETGRILDLFTEFAPDYGPAFTLSGQYYSIMGQTALALEKLERANELLPEDDIAWRQRLQLLLAEGRYRDAIDAGEKANEFAPEDAFIQFFIGTAHLILKEYPSAVDWLKQASRAPARRPFKSVIYGSLGDAYSAQEMFEDSDRSYELSLRYDSENHNSMNNFAYNLSVRGEQLDRARELALKAIDLAPTNAAYLDTVGWVYFKLGDYDRARRFIRASIDTGEASGEVLEHLGDVYEKLGDLNEARLWWQKALEADPERTYLNEKL